MYQIRKPWILVLGAFALGGLLAAAASAAPEGGVVAEVVVKPDVIYFDPVIEHDGLTLTFSGPFCQDTQTKWRPGEVPEIGIFNADGKLRDDGVYSWQLQAVPVVNPDLLATLLRAREKGDMATIIEAKREGIYPEGAVQSGSFSIVEGRFVLPEQEDKAQATTVGEKDFVINDDLIVDGSACIGFDCVNGESFGFDTIRLKENNLRIKFDDTSVAASFPRNDWQLTANDSANGGASKFSIDDISGARTPFTVEANAPSHSLYVDDGGRVGFGTSTPSVELHTIDGDTPTLRLQQDGSSGFAPQTWDVAGNETNFFVRDVSNGSTLPLRIRPGAPSSSIFIDVGGDVGIGTSSPDADLHVEGKFLVVADGNPPAEPPEAMQIYSETDNAARIRFTDGHQWNAGGGAGNTFVIFEASDAAEFTLDAGGNLTIAGTLTQGSDVAIKENFSDVDPNQVLQKVLALPLSTWNYKADDPSIRQMGPMAQDFFASFGLGGTDKGIQPYNLASVALAAIKGMEEEKDAQIQSLEQRNNELAQRVAELESLVHALVGQGGN